MEIRIKSVNKDNSHSWVRISHGLSKLVTNLNNKEQETSKIQFEECALKLNAGDFASRSKVNARPQGGSSSTRTIPIGEGTWTDVEPRKYSISDYPVSKKLINFLCRGSLPRDNDGAIEFWRTIKIIFRIIRCIVIIGLTKNGRTAWQEEEVTRKETSIVLIHQEQSCTFELFKAIQDAVSLVLLYKTISLFRTVSSSTFIMSDVQSIYIPSSIQD